MYSNQLFSDTQQHLRDRGAVSTSSRLRVWWLVRVKRWRMMQHSRVPIGTAFGQMHYRRSWVLAPPK